MRAISLRPLAFLPLLLSLEAVASAQSSVPAREANVIVYGDDDCPPPADPEEIVVCARQPEEERYRIPEPLRRGDRRPEMSWSSQLSDLEDAQRDTRPNSCSVVGSFGQSGCHQQMVRQWHAERRSRPN